MAKKQMDNVIQFPSRETKKESVNKDAMIVNSLPLVRIIAKRIARKTPPNVELDDLISSGIIGLIDAIQKYDPTKGTKFKTYAEHRIRGSILDELRAQDWIPRSIRKKEKLLERSISKLENDLGRGVTTKDLTKELNMEQEDFYSLLNAVRPAKLVRFDDFTNMTQKENGMVSGYIDGIYKNNPFKSVSYKSSQTYILKTMESLTKNEQIIINLYYYECKNLREISAILGITESRVSQLHMRAKGKMKDWLTGEFSCYEDLAA